MQIWSSFKYRLIDILGDDRANALKDIYEYITCFLSRSTLVLIYQMGKVGSQSIYYSLIDADIFPIFFFHEFKLLQEQERLRYRYLEYALNQQKHIKIITLVRDPVARNISSFAHDFFAYFGVPMQAHTLDQLESMYWQYDRHQYGIKWFDNEFNRNLGVDVYSHDFDRVRGYGRITQDNFEILIIKLENPDQIKEKAIIDFLGLSKFNLKRFNTAADKWYKKNYREFVKKIKLPEDYLNGLYESKFCKHFYTIDEVDGFRKMWLH